MMEKNGKVEAGVTPSEVSGRQSETIKDGQALCVNEKPEQSTVEKVARLLKE